MRGVFVTGTGTGVGKTVVSGALCAALRAQGTAVLASKPLLSGLDDQPLVPWPHDHELLAITAGGRPEEIAPVRFGPPVSPHLAARLAGTALTVDGITADLLARHAASPEPDPVVVVEGAGGLLVPIDDDGATMVDLAAATGLPLVIAAHSGLGTINHVLLTLEAARARGLRVAGVVLTPWAEQPTLVETDNRDYLTRRAGGVPILGLTAIAGPDPALLAAAGQDAGLPALIPS